MSGSIKNYVKKSTTRTEGDDNAVRAILVTERNLVTVRDFVRPKETAFIPEDCLPRVRFKSPKGMRVAHVGGYLLRYFDTKKDKYVYFYKTGFEFEAVYTLA